MSRGAFSCLFRGLNLLSWLQRADAKGSIGRSWKVDNDLQMAAICMSEKMSRLVYRVQGAECRRRSQEEEEEDGEQRGEWGNGGNGGEIENWGRLGEFGVWMTIIRGEERQKTEDRRT